MLETVLGSFQVMVRVAMALLFLTSVWGKIRRWDEFVGAVANYRLLPALLVAPAAVVVAGGEAVAGVALIASPLVPLGAGVGAALMLLFATAIGVNVLRGRRAIDCGCDLAARGQPLSGGLVARNLIFAGLLFACLIPAPALDALLWVSAAIAAVASFCLYLAFNQLSAAALRPAGARGAR